MNDIQSVAGIYAIKHIASNKMYIGSSVNISKRLYEHRRLLDLGKHSNQHLQSAWTIYGKESFEFSVLEDVVDIDKLYVIERIYIHKYLSFDREFGYNKASETTAPQRGLKRSDETKKKIGISKIGNKNMLGKHHSEETKEKLRLANIGKKLSPEHIAKLSTSLKGIERTVEWRAAIGIAHKGKIIPQEMRDRISATLKGRKVPTEVLEKRRQFFINRANNKLVSNS